MKLFFMHVIPQNNSIYSKVKNQIKVFRQYESEGALEFFDYVREEVQDGSGDVTLKVGNKKIKFFKNRKRFGVLFTLLVSYPLLYKTVTKYLVDNGFTHIFIRRTICDRFFIHFLKKLKKHGITIIYEIPTWPYDKEFPEGSWMLKIEQKWRTLLSDYVDRIVTPSYGFSNILGVPVIYIPNGILSQNIKPVRGTNAAEKNTINLFAVAGLSAWHGYDRLIKGLIDYKNKGGQYNVVFHLVGGEKDNKFRIQYEELVKKGHLEDCVKFYGTRHGDELDSIYDVADIAVSSLGLHRLGLDISTTLKSREYLAKGLPIITEGKIDLIPADYPYVLSFPMDESPININDVVEFYKRVYFASNVKRDEIVKTIREYACKTCDMYYLNKGIINFVNEEKTR